MKKCRESHVGGDSGVVLRERAWRLVDALWGRQGGNKAPLPLPREGASKESENLGSGNVCINAGVLVFFHCPCLERSFTLDSWSRFERRTQAVSRWLQDLSYSKSIETQARQQSQAIAMRTPSIHTEENAAKILDLLHAYRVDDAASLACDAGMLR